MTLPTEQAASTDRHDATERERDAREWSAYDDETLMSRPERERYEADQAMSRLRVDMMLSALAMDGLTTAYR